MGGGGGDGRFSGTRGSGGATKHGAQRIRERKFTDEIIARAKQSSNIKHQNDGAKVYIDKVSRGKFNVVIVGREDTIVTVFKKINRKELNNLAKNYDWR